MSSVLQNPFDFSNPVRRADALAGRKQEVDEGMYYLGQGSGETSYSLALIGDRASGKTSLLNVLGEQAMAGGQLCAQISLDETIMSSELSFFREVFAALMDAGVQCGMFGGPTGAKYLKFIDQVELLNTEVAPGEEPLAFGRIYAVARTQGRELAPSRVRLAHDFGVIIEEAREAKRTGIVVLIDECDLLGQNRGLLQALRNLLMDLTGLQMVLAGTEAMFPAIEDVFSPVPRQFVRINVGNFERLRDTQDAVRTRLRQAGLEWAMPDPQMVYDLHRVTRGNPYEVMLLSHFAFRDTVDPDERGPMRLTAAALEDVARQLEEQDPDLQAAVSQVRSLSERDAEILMRALSLDEVRLDDFGFAATAFDLPFDQGSANAATEEARRLLSKIESTRFIELPDKESVEVHAEEFERLYIRYSVLGAVEGDLEFPELRNPRTVLAEKTADLLRAHFADRYADSQSNLVLSEAWPGDPTGSDYAFAVSDLLLDSYRARVDVPIDSAGADWSATLWVPEIEPSDGTQREIRDFVSEINAGLAPFPVRMGAARVGPIDRDEVVSLREVIATEGDPSVQAIVDAADAVIERNEDAEERIREAIEMVRTAGFRDEARKYVNPRLSDLAFMAFGVLGPEAHDEVLGLIDGDNRNAPLALGTQALRLAGSSEFDHALRLLEEARAAERPANDDFGSVYMYGPQMLVAHRETPTIDEIVGGVPLNEILAVYDVAIRAAQREGPVADAVRNMDDPPGWALEAVNI